MAAWNPEISTAHLDGPLAPGSTFRWRSGPGAITSVLREVQPGELLLEFAGVIAVGYWGLRVIDGPGRWLIAIGAPVLLIVFWALAIAPGANVPIPQQIREVVGSIVLLAAAGALYAAGAQAAAFGFAGLVIVNTVLSLSLRA